MISWLQMKPLNCVFHFRHMFWVRKETPLYFNSETQQELMFPSKLLLGCLAASKDLQIDYLANSLAYESWKIWQRLVIYVLLFLGVGNKSKKVFYLKIQREKVLSALHLHYLSSASKYTDSWKLQKGHIMMPRNQQSNHEMAVLHYSLQNINGVRTLQTDVQQGFKILPNCFLVHYFWRCATLLSRLRTVGGRQPHNICSPLRSCAAYISSLLHLPSSKSHTYRIKILCVIKQHVFDLQNWS